jgi:molybdate transport system substrate-binding protein
VYNAGLLDLATAYTNATGKKVAVNSVGMGGIVNAIKTANPPADVIMLPFELAATLSLDGGVVPGTFTPLGRSQMGLAVPAGAPHPDISTVEKLAAALRGAKAVMRSNAAGGSMVARVIEDKVIKRPEFAGVHSPVSTQGEGGQALARGEGDLAIQAICEILPYKQIELVGPLPRSSGRGSTCPPRFRPAIHGDDAPPHQVSIGGRSRTPRGRRRDSSVSTDDRDLQA